MKPTALVLDTETDQGHDPLPIQVATLDPITHEEWMQYFNSGRPISPITTQVHGITDQDVAGLAAFDLRQFDVPEYLIAHNATFDWRVIGRPQTKLICTVKLARLAFPHWKSYRQSSCIEQIFESYGEDGRQQAAALTAKAHDALGDVRMCVLIYKVCCEQLQLDYQDFERVYQLLQHHAKSKPRTSYTKRHSLTDQGALTMPFGKYKGVEISQIPKGYVRWLLDNAIRLDEQLQSALIMRLAS